MVSMRSLVKSGSGQLHIHIARANSLRLSRMTSKSQLFGLCLVCRGAAVLPMLYYALCMPWHATLGPAGQHLLSASKHCLLVLILCAGMV